MVKHTQQECFARALVSMGYTEVKKSKTKKTRHFSHFSHMDIKYPIHAFLGKSGSVRRSDTGRYSDSYPIDEHLKITMLRIGRELLAAQGLGPK